MRVTVQDIRDWCEAEKEGIDNGLEASEAVPAFLKASAHFQPVWAAGCWLMFALEEAGCPEDERHEIGFAHGQRSVFGDSYEWAAQYFNEWAASSSTPEAPGAELAQQIMDEVIG